MLLKQGRFLDFRNRLKPIAFASKSLSEAETRYSNIERELLGVVWAVQHFNHYTFANKVHIISDHKPLQPLFNGKMLVTCSPRTARLLLKIIDKDIKFYYQNGPTMHVCDALSRLSDHNTKRGTQRKSKDSIFKSVKLVLFNQTSQSIKYKLKQLRILICNNSLSIS